MTPIVVIKVGGSLLDWAELPAKLASFLDAAIVGRPILICGGGEIVESIRDLDRIHSIGDEAAHRLAISAMGVTAEILESIVPGTERVDRLDLLENCWARRRVPVLAPRQFLASDDVLPHSWSVTSDSIAARLAVRVEASALILLKSAALPDRADRAEASRLGLVDPAFPLAALRLRRVLYANLRAVPPEIRELN